MARRPIGGTQDETAQHRSQGSYGQRSHPESLLDGRVRLLSSCCETGAGGELVDGGLVGVGGRTERAREVGVGEDRQSVG